MLRVLVHRFYAELWKARKLAVADEILAPGVTFRGSLGGVRNGRQAFREGGTSAPFGPRRACQLGHGRVPVRGANEGT